MDLRRIASFIVSSSASSFAAASAYAQTAGAEASVAVPSSMLEEHASPWKAVLENPIVAAIIVLALVGVVALTVVMRQRKSSSRDRYLDGGPVTYMGGYDTIAPTGRKEPQLPPQKKAAPQAADNPGEWEVPADFDVPRFLRKTKAYFMRLQASWDNADIKDIRRFTTRELFGEFCKQLNERAGAPSATEVVTLGAELQGVETAGEYYIATVKFTGMVKEDDAEVTPFSEIWNLSKPLDGHRSWVLTSIQQPV